MKIHAGRITRRSFLKKSGRVLALSAVAGAVPAAIPVRKASAGVPLVKFAYILSDHHAPLILAAKNHEMFSEKYNLSVRPVTEGRFYDFYFQTEKLARVQLIAAKKGPDVEKLVAQGSVDMAISGTQAILMSIDRGVDTQIVSPMQTEGNVFVLDSRLGMESWEDFTGHVKSAGRQFTIGIPGPHTVAAVIFRSALDHEGISYTENARDKSADVLFINMKGHGNLVTALSSNITRGIIGAEPFCSITIHRELGKRIANLQDMPPKGRWNGHACCSLAATSRFMQKEPELYLKMMELMALSILETDNNKQLAAAACADWLGVDRQVEELAMQSLSYSFEPTKNWQTSVYKYAQTMDAMEMFNGKLKSMPEADIYQQCLNFSGLTKARAALKSRGVAV